MAAEQLGLSLSGQCSEAQKAGYLDAGRRPIQILGHSAIFPLTPQDRRDTQPGPSVTFMRHDMPPTLPEPICPDATLLAAACSFIHVPVCSGLAGLK